MKRKRYRNTKMEKHIDAWWEERERERVEWEDKISALLSDMIKFKNMQGNGARIDVTGALPKNQTSENAK